MTLRADDGTPLETKEGIVIDQQGRPLIDEPHPRVRSFSFTLPFPALIGAAIFLPIAFAVGITFFVGLLLIFSVFMLFTAISRFLKNS